MASPAAPTIERVAEPAAPAIEPVWRDTFPDVALGIVRAPEPDPQPAAAPAEDAPEAPATSTAQVPAVPEASGPPSEPAAPADNAPAPEAASASEEPKADVLSRAEHEAEVQRRVEAYARKRDEEARQKATEQARAEQQRQFDELLAQSQDDSDPLAQAEATRQLAQHFASERLRTQVQAELLPTVQATALNAIRTEWAAQTQAAAKDLGLSGEATTTLLASGDVTELLRNTATLLRAQFEQEKADLRAKWEKDELHPLAEAKAAQARAEMRVLAPNPDLAEGVGSGGGATRFTSEDDVRRAHTAGQISNGQARYWLSQLRGVRRAA